MTLFEGRIVARDGAMVDGAIGAAAAIPGILRDTIHLTQLDRDALRLAPDEGRQAVGVIPGEIATRLLDVEPEISDGEAIAAPERDLLKLVCVERHHGTGRVGVGYVQGFGLTRGALASSIAHDAHNIVAVGADDRDILRAIDAVAGTGGGLAVVADGEVNAATPLPIAGILSDQPLADAAAGVGAVEEAAKALGSELPSPFGLLGFLALSVIPEARVTDRGFVRVG
jgi:adenine deaminase